MKYKTITIPAQDNQSCEMFQRLAMSFGYAWGVQGSQVQKVDALSWLTFDPNSKLIEKTDKTAANINDNAVATNANDLLTLLKSPVPLARVLVNSSKTASAELLANGGVKVNVSGKCVTVDREMVKLLADELGFSQKAVAPLVKFEYPESNRGGLPKVRFVRLVSMDDSYLKGYEVDTVNSKAVGEFKNFVRNRILDGGKVEIVKFSM